MNSKLHVTIRGLRITRNDVSKNIWFSALPEVAFFDLISLLAISNVDNKTASKYSNPMNAVVHLTSTLVTKLQME
jgi:hypothetical protein